MNQASHPDANRLVYRIRTAITGESKGIETAKLAWQYAIAIERANATLANAADCVSSNRLLEAVLIDHSFPRLLEAAEELDFAQTNTWGERCEAYNWRKAESIDKSLLETVKSAIESIEKPKEWLFGEYRNAVRSKNQSEAYRIISALSSKFPEDANAKEECQRHETNLLEQLATDIKNFHEELIPTEQSTEILARYRAIDLSLSKSKSQLVTDAIEAEAKAIAKSDNQAVETLLGGATSEAISADWKKVEQRYLEYEYTVAVNGTRGKIEAGSRSEFEKLGTELSRFRNTFEAEVAIRQAIDELKASLAKNGRVKAAPGQKPVRPAQRLEKLRSLEKQAIRTSGQISPELQAEIKEAYALAKKKRLPKLAAIGGIAAVVACSLFLLGKGLLDNNAEKERENTALLALEKAEADSLVRNAEQILSNYQTEIAQSEPTSELANQAAILEEWINAQRELEETYIAEASGLESLMRSTDPYNPQGKVDTALQSLDNIRNGLAQDLGQETTQTIASLKLAWQNTIAQAKQAGNQQIAQLHREIGLATQNAGKSKTRDEFDRLYNAAENRMVQLVELVEKTKAEKEASETLIESSRSTLAELQSKWTTLAASRIQLEKSETLASYLDTLKRIHSFDILPAKEKSEIDQTLKLESAFSALKTKIALPNNLGIWQEFASGEDYQSTLLELDAAEIAFIDRLAENTVFNSVYSSTVQYFEGDPEPQSEYQILLVEPIAKSDSEQDASNVSFTFKIRGFDEFGNAETSARDVQFISRNDGSFWGFFYKPSDLSPESKYFRGTIKSALGQLKSNPNRLYLIEQISLLDEQEQLSPAFKAYWQSKFIELATINPTKWGLALSPSLQEKAQLLSAIFDGNISDRLWLSTLEQTIPSPELSALYESEQNGSATEEVIAIATLYSNAMKGNVALAGWIQKDGATNLSKRLPPSEALWTVNALTGQIERLREGLELTPYAPILHYAFDNGDKIAMLKRTEFATGFDFSDERISNLLPPLFEE